MVELFKKDSKGKLRVLKIYTEGDKLVQESGLFGGKLVINEKVCMPKNVGRSNATTGEQQAILEAESKIAEKLKEDYFKTKEEAETTTVVLPMLAKDYKEFSHKIDWTQPVYAQPKLDGMRALGKTGAAATLTSREGTAIETMAHIIKALQTTVPGLILDGELYCHGLSFQENMKLIKKNRGETSEQIQYHVYDMISDLPFTGRDTEKYLGTIPGFVQVPTYKIDDEAALKLIHAQFIHEGYEGTIVRHGNAGYKLNGRSENLLKYKDFKDISLPIKDIRPSEARPDEGVAVYDWPGATNGELRSGMKLSKEERREWLTNKDNYIGKTAEVRFFEYSDTGVPRFPVTVGIRLDK